MIKTLAITAIAAFALSACGPKCRIVSQEVAYQADDGSVQFMTVEREICPTITQVDTSNPVHSGTGEMTGRMIRAR